MTDKPGQGETVDRWGIVWRDRPSLAVFRIRCQHWNAYEIRHQDKSGWMVDRCTCLDCAEETTWTWRPGQRPKMPPGTYERYRIDDTPDSWQPVGNGKRRRATKT